MNDHKYIGKNKDKVREYRNLLKPLVEDLDCEIQRLEELLKFNDDLKIKYDILSEIVEQIDINNYSKLLDDKIMISMQLDFVFGADNVYNILLLNVINEISLNYSDSLQNLKVVENFKEKLNRKLRGFKNRISNVDEAEINKKISVYYSFKSNLRRYLPIKPFQYSYIKRYLKSKKCNNFELIEICTNMEGYNNAIYGKSKYEDVSEILDILKIGYEDFPNIDLGNIKNYDVKKLVDSLYETCCDYVDDFSSFSLFLPKYNEKLYSVSQYQKIYFDFMKKIQMKKIYDIVETLKDEEFYFNKDFRTEILKDYEKWLSIYLSCRDFFDKQLLFINNNDKEISEVKDDNQNMVMNRFLFSMSSSGSYFERDLKDVPREYYERICYLLNGKRYGTLTQNEDAQLLNHNIFKGYRELRDDQIRILYKNLHDNIIVIYGIGVKKSDNDRNMYTRLVSRPTPNVDLSDDVECFDRIINYLEDNKRKGNR